MLTYILTNKRVHVRGRGLYAFGPHVNALVCFVSEIMQS